MQYILLIIYFMNRLLTSLLLVAKLSTCANNCNAQTSNAYAVKTTSASSEIAQAMNQTPQIDTVASRDFFDPISEEPFFFLLPGEKLPEAIIWTDVVPVVAGYLVVQTHNYEALSAELGYDVIPGEDGLVTIVIGNTGANIVQETVDLKETLEKVIGVTDVSFLPRQNK